MYPQRQSFFVTPTHSKNTQKCVTVIPAVLIIYWVIVKHCAGTRLNAYRYWFEAFYISESKSFCAHSIVEETKSVEQWMTYQASPLVRGGTGIWNASCLISVPGEFCVCLHIAWRGLKWVVDLSQSLQTISPS